MESSKKSKFQDYVTYGVFFTVIGLVMTVVGYLFTVTISASSTVDKVQDDQAEVNKTLTGVQKDVSWIRSNMEKGYYNK